MTLQTQTKVNKMKKILITGGTGSGKTYHAFKMAKSFNMPFAYLAPTALLALECYTTYGTFDDELSAKGFAFKGKGLGYDFYGLYANKRGYNAYGTIIIDEAHFAFGFDEHLYNVQDILENFEGNIILVTATQNFETPKGFEVINLESKVNFEKQNVSHQEALKRLKDGVPTLYLCQTKWEAEERFYNTNNSYLYCDVVSHVLKNKAVLINGQSSTKEVLKAVKAFREGNITCIVATNIAAQGINLSCENLIIEDCNQYACNSLIHQKLGRLGRMGHTKQDAILTYCNLGDEPEEIEKINKFILNKDMVASEDEEDNFYAPPIYKQKQKGKIISLLQELKRAA